MATFSVPLKTFILDICSSIKKFNEMEYDYMKRVNFLFTTVVKKTHTHLVTNVWRQPVTIKEIFHIHLAVHKWYLYHQQQQSSAPHIGVLFIRGPVSFLN